MIVLVYGHVQLSYWAGGSEAGDKGDKCVGAVQEGVREDNYICSKEHYNMTKMPTCIPFLKECMEAFTPSRWRINKHPLYHHQSSHRQYWNIDRKKNEGEKKEHGEGRKGQFRNSILVNVSCSDKKSRKQQKENGLRTVMPFRGQNDIL